MFSGKTEELVRRLRRSEFANKNVLTIKHKIDTRKSHSCIVSHNGVEREAFPISSCEEGIESLKKVVNQNFDVIGIDEIQFFPRDIIEIIEELVANGKRVIVAGLDLDFRAEPFGIVPELMALADDVLKLHAICLVCGDEANFTQRLINGQPAKYEDQQILVGADECYEARCRSCFKIDKKAYVNV